MKDEEIYRKYHEITNHYSQLIAQALNSDSIIYYRIDVCITVLDYLLNEYMTLSKLSEDEEVIFKVVLDYFENQLLELTNLLKEYFNNDLKLFFEHEQQIDLIMNTIEFQNEMLRIEHGQAADLKYFKDYETRLVTKLKNQVSFEQQDFTELDQQSAKIFKQYQDFYPLKFIIDDIESKLYE
jgi:hypothetical protein